MRPGFGGLKKA